MFPPICWGEGRTSGKPLPHVVRVLSAIAFGEYALSVRLSLVVPVPLSGTMANRGDRMRCEVSLGRMP